MKSYKRMLALIVLSSLCLATASAATAVNENNSDAGTAAAVQQLEKKVEAQQAEIDQLKQAKPADPEKDAMESKLSDLAHGKVKLGATFFGDFAIYPDGAYAPGFLDNQAALPTPGQENYNAFEIRRAYLNFFYTPTKHVTLRVTPDLFINSDQSRGFRLKYGYAEVKNIFPKDSLLGKTVLRLGQTQNPIIDFQEGINNHRYAYKTPWDYLGLSSTFVGAVIKGPISFHGKEYLDYHIGVFNNAGYHNNETNSEKQAMGRLTIYPLGTKKDGHGLGITFFDGYGYTTPSVEAGAATAQNRGTGMVHYVSNSGKYRAGFAYDFGRNVLTLKQVTGGGGAIADFAGVDTADFHTNSWMQSFDVFGSGGLGHTPFSLFGIWQYVQPDTDISSNPLDYQRIVGGIQYRINKQFRLAATSENFVHTRGNDLANAIIANGGTAAGAGRATQDLHGAMINLEYNY